MSYNSKLSVLDTQKAIKIIKVKFEEELCQALDLTRISPPLFVDIDSGLNDDLNGCERPVTFETKSGMYLSVVQSLAKWKRFALKKYGFEPYTGLYANMNAVRRDEDLTPIHSYYVDQWDWEMVIEENDRNLDFLKKIVTKIYDCVVRTEKYVCEKFPALGQKLPNEIVFVSSQEVEDAYPQLTPKEREDKFAEKHGAVFIMQVGKTLKSGSKHDGRAPDYDDWELNGDILVHYPVLGTAFELSSMGIRVSKESLLVQLEERGAMDRLRYPFHKALVNGELPFTIGGGFGQSRLCMFLLDKIHIGEVQVSVWDDDTIAKCEKNNIKLL